MADLPRIHASGELPQNMVSALAESDRFRRGISRCVTTDNPRGVAEAARASAVLVSWVERGMSAYWEVSFCVVVAGMTPRYGMRSLVTLPRSGLSHSPAEGSDQSPHLNGQRGLPASNATS